MLSIDSFTELLNDLRAESFRNEKAYNKICKAFVEKTNAEACSIFIFDTKMNRLVMRGDHGHLKSLVDCEEEHYTYSPDEGVTGKVYSTGKSSRVANRNEVSGAPGHISKLYKAQWKGDHTCYSWFQFPIFNMNNRPLGVIKIENKRDDNNELIVDGGFTDDEIRSLEFVAGLIAPFILMNSSSDVDESIGWTRDIYTIFPKNLIEQLCIASSSSDKAAEVITKFCNDVRSKENTGIHYVNFTRDYIKDIFDVYGLSETTQKYCDLLNEYETLLYSIPNYRGHYVHQFSVFLNGYVILKNLDDKLLSLFYESFANNGVSVFANTCEGKLDMLLKCWFVIAIFHDASYPISKIEDWVSIVVSQFLRNVNGNDISTIASKGFVEKLATNLRSTILPDLIDIAEKSHSWVGVKVVDLFVHIHVAFFEEMSNSILPGIIIKRAFQGDKENEWLIGAAISAIFLDDEKSQKFVLSREDSLESGYFPWRRHPLAFLLTVCDSAQEIGRPKASAGRVNPESVIAQTIEVSGTEIMWRLYYTRKPSYWEKIVEGKIKEVQNFWHTGTDLISTIEYRELGNKKLEDGEIGRRFSSMMIGDVKK